MKRFVGLVIFIFSLLIAGNIKAQDTLPKFNIKEISKKKILITWINPFSYLCIQLSVQRSFDSLHYFSTIYSSQSPELPQNGVLDNRMPKGVTAYYRIFYVLANGEYYFSKSIGIDSYKEKLAVNCDGIRPTDKTDRIIFNHNVADTNSNGEPLKITYFKTDAEKWISIFKSSTDSLLMLMTMTDFTKFKDSIIAKTKDTLYYLNDLEVMLKPYILKKLWKPSVFIYTNESNNLIVHLPLFKQHKYKIIFYEENGAQLFEIKQLRESDITIENMNFLHAGWFSFDLYEDDKLKEHNKFQIYLPF